MEPTHAPETTTHFNPLAAALPAKDGYDLMDLLRS